MNDRQLHKLGLDSASAQNAARRCISHAEAEGMSGAQIKKCLRRVAKSPHRHLNDAFFAPLAEVLTGRQAQTVVAGVRKAGKSGAHYQQWGTDLDPQAVLQMEQACSLPVAVRGALMPDAHVGYGLPIGGVLATENAVIPYAVGVDIACRIKMTVLDLPSEGLEDERSEHLRSAIETQTRFGIGAYFQHRRTHVVMDEDWSVSPITRQLKDKAWGQLGTSGSGNHFVEFGVLQLDTTGLGPDTGRYLALLTHSGSRGTGAEVCAYYSKIAQGRCKGLPPDLRRLAWLAMDSQEGREYWAAMELMGRYAAANHELIHRHIAEHLGAQVLLDIENHHNFAWKEIHDGRAVIVHRKGATPAGKGVMGIIPGSMASPAYIVCGKGNPDSLESVSHGAGRRISRTQAKKTLTWGGANKLLQIRKVKVISAGLDEVPAVYKDIDQVMACQKELAEILGQFNPRLVKMAPSGERPED